MILGFNPRFVKPIMSGTKIHTIRKDELRRWRKGRSIQMATGVRTKHYNKFNEGVCISCQNIFMTYAYSDLIEISINGRELTYYKEREDFAKNDGFETWEEFFDWFYPIIQNHPDKCFSGRIIHWTDKRY